MRLPAKLSGTTVKFKGDGRKLGYPTANIKSDTKLTDGVYFGHVDLGKYKKQPALIFIGTPTTMGETERRVEAYLLDIPDVDYYDLPIELDIQKFHRRNQTFKSIDELMVTMNHDEKSAREWFKQTG